MYLEYIVEKYIKRLFINKNSVENKIKKGFHKSLVLLFITAS